MTSSPELEENDKYLVFHEVTSTISWHSNGDNFAPTASIMYDGKLIRGDSRGYTFAHDPSLYADPVVDIVIPAGDWATAAVPYNIKTAEIDGGDCLLNKQFAKIYLHGKPETNSTFKIQSFDNGCDTPKSLSIVEFKVGDGCHLSVTRRFPCSRTMSKSKQVEISATEAVIDCGTTDPADFVNYDPQENSISRANTELFTPDNIGQTVCIEGQEVQISNIIFGGKAEVILSAPKPVLGAYPWALKGLEKQQKFNLSCLGLVYCVLGDVGGEFTVDGSKTTQWNSYIGSQ